MKDKLKNMMKKGSFAAYRLTENSCLEILGRDCKIVDNYFLFDGANYYFSNQLIQFTSAESVHNNLLLAQTDTKLLIPKNNEDYLYIARNFPANKNLLVVVLYCYDGLLYYSIISGYGSGRVHPICLPFTKENFKFYFYSAVETIAATDSEISEALYACLMQKSEEARAAMTEPATDEICPK